MFCRMHSSEKHPRIMGNNFAPLWSMGGIPYTNQNRITQLKMSFISILRGRDAAILGMFILR